MTYWAAFTAKKVFILYMHGLHMGVVQSQNITEMNCGGYPTYEVKLREGVLFKYSIYIFVYIYSCKYLIVLRSLDIYVCMLLYLCFYCKSSKMSY